jgi:hypothetical protein
MAVDPVGLVGEYDCGFRRGRRRGGKSLYNKIYNDADFPLHPISKYSKKYNDAS